ncbi:MAG: hypothetical protein K2X41_13000, partial [Hyphomicrobium sp.]|nr:hypothetical protein [Hyphomicrobium sp.]
LDKDTKIGSGLLLADEFVERLWADVRFESVRLFALRCDQPFGHGLFVTLFGSGVKVIRPHSSSAA